MSLLLRPSPAKPAFSVVALLGLAACQTGQSASAPPTPAKTQARIAEEQTATAQVVALDPARRCVTLRREDGRLLDVHVGEAVRNYDQIEVGDALRVHYQATMVATRRPAGEPAQPAKATVMAARAEKGAKPAGGVGVAFTLRVRIESIDVPNDIVVFSLASGELIAHRLATDEGRGFVKGLKVGDIVHLDYDEALALTIEELPRAG